MTGILSSSEMGDRSLRAMLLALGRESGLQELLPHLSLYLSTKETKASTRSLHRLRTLVAGMEAVWTNPHLHAEFHLQQMLPAIFALNVASKLRLFCHGGSLVPPFPRRCGNRENMRQI